MLSKIQIVGNVGQNPEVRYTNTGAMNLSFSVAVNRRTSKKSSDEQRPPLWYKVTAWGKLAESLHHIAEDGNLDKGASVFVAGRLDVSEFADRGGKPRYSLDVNADDVLLLGNRCGGKDAPVMPEIDELPF